jgi:hypothetical protein
MYKTLHHTKKEFAVEFFECLKANLLSHGQNPSEYLFVIPTGGFGEHTYILSLLPTLRRSRRVCLVIEKSKTWLMQIFPYSADFVIFFDDIHTDVLFHLMEISWLREGHPFVASTDHIANGRFNQHLVTGHGRLTLAEGYAFLLELPIDTPLTLPAPVDQDPSLSNQNTVLVVPHANTIVNFNQDFWRIVCDNLAASGHNVVIDSFKSSTSDLPFPQISLPKLEFVRYATGCKAVVGLRSGLFDLLGGYSCGTSLKLFPLYHIIENINRFSTGIHRRGASKSGISVSRIWNSKNVIELEAEGTDCASQIALEIHSTLS